MTIIVNNRRKSKVRVFHRCLTDEHERDHSDDGSRFCAVIEHQAQTALR